MIEHIEIENFKSLQKVSLDLGPLNIFVGTNASGKTNFLEALRVLQGIGYGYTVDEILNGRPRLGNTEAWEGIRGGSSFGGFRTPTGEERLVRFCVRASLPPVTGPVGYSIAFSSKRGTVTSETDFAYGSSHVLPPRFSATDRTRASLIDPTDPDQPRRRAIELLFKYLSDLQWLSPSPAVLRDYSAAPGVDRMGDHGENFAALIRAILKDPTVGSAYTSWLKELTPAELDGIEILPGAASDFMFALRRNGVAYPAPVLSDGTLRFAAIAAAFFQPDPPKLLLLEEIEDGLHPTRLQLLVELLKSQTGHGVEQVIATTHSPYTIAWLDEEDYRYVFLCTKDDETGATTITPFTEVPHLIEVARRHPISDLLARGWLETAV